MQVTLRCFDGCPNRERALERVRSVLRELGVDASVRVERVESDDDAERLGFRGSPTVLIDGVDPFPHGPASTGLACRVYETPSGPSGVPTRDQLRTAVRAAGRG